MAAHVRRAIAPAQPFARQFHRGRRGRSPKHGACPSDWADTAIFASKYAPALSKQHALRPHDRVDLAAAQQRRACGLGTVILPNKLFPNFALQLFAAYLGSVLGLAAEIAPAQSTYLMKKNLDAPEVASIGHAARMSRPRERARTSHPYYGAKTSIPARPRIFFREGTPELASPCRLVGRSIQPALALTGRL